jgi:hypothetical protein
MRTSETISLMWTIASRLGIRVRIATLGLVLGLVLSPILLLAQTFLNYEVFDPGRIGLPALTEDGRDELIEQHKQLIEEARRAIEDINRSDLSNGPEIIARYEEDILEEHRQIARLAGGRAQDAMKMAVAGRSATSRTCVAC